MGYVYLTIKILCMAYNHCYRYEQMAETLHQQSFNMEQATSTLQAAQTNQQIFTAMKDGAKEMKKVYKNLKIEDVDVSSIFLLKNNVFFTSFGQ